MALGCQGWKVALIEGRECPSCLSHGRWLTLVDGRAVATPIVHPDMEGGGLFD